MKIKLSKRIKNSNRKTKVYVGIILVCFACVFIRIKLVQRDRGRVIVSFVSEWNSFGKPVTVEKITARDVFVYTKLTVRGSAGKRAAGFVTGDIKDQLYPGNEVFFTDKTESCGTIVTIGRKLDIDTGMFPVEIEFNETLPPEEPVVVFVRTKTLSNALVVPNEILDFFEGEYYLWKVEDAKAERIQVKVSSRNGYGAVIGEGINPGDLIVFNGRSMLSENALVRIVSDKGRAL